MRDKTLNMTSGNTMKLLIVFSIPMLIGNVFQQLYNLVDSVIVGRLVGAGALAAIGATSSVTFFFFALCNGVASGGGIITSQAFGDGNDKRIKSCIANTAYIMLAMPLIVGFIASAIASPVLNLLETPQDIMPDAVLYIRVMCMGLVFVSLYNFVSSMLRALGDSKTPLYFLIFASILNVILDIVFVYYLRMSVFGAAIATVISQFVSGVACLGYAIKYNEYFHLSKEDFAINKVLISKTLKLGIPLSLQFSMIAISCMALQRVVNSFGAVAVAAFTATSRIEQIIHQPYQTIGAALTTYIGQNYGAQEKERMKVGYRKGMLLMIIFTILMMPIMQIWGNEIVAIFVKDSDVIAMGGVALRISSLFYCFLGVIYVVRGYLNGIGDSFFALLNGIVEVIGRFTVPVMLTHIATIGLWGIWWSVGIVWFISGFTAWLRYLAKKEK